MRSETVTEVTGWKLNLTADEARGLYASLYHMCNKLGVASPNGRGLHAELVPLFEIYDRLNMDGFNA